MNQSQQKFYDFVMARVKEDKVELAKSMMLESFKLQDEGKFTKEIMQKNAPQIMACIKEEFVGEFRSAAAHMSSTLR